MSKSIAILRRFLKKRQFTVDSGGDDPVLIRDGRARRDRQSAK